MYGMKKIISALFIGLNSLMVACVSTETFVDKSRFVINLDATKEKDFIEMSSLFDKENVDVIALDTIFDEALIGSMDKIAFCDDFLLVLDAYVAKKLLVFDKKGQFIRQLGSIGQGPSEYVFPRDFTYDTDSGIVYVLDFDSQKINLYHIASGEFIKSMPCPTGISNIQYYDGLIYGNTYMPIAGKEKEFLLAIIDAKSGELLDCHIDPVQYNAGWSGRLANTGGPFLNYGRNGIRFSNLFSNTVFREDSERGIVPYLSIESQKWMTKEDLEGININSVEGAMKLYTMDNYSDIHDYIEHDSIFVCRIQNKINNCYVFADFSSGDICWSGSLQENILFEHVGTNLLNLTFGECTNSGVYYYVSPAQKDLFFHYRNKLSSQGKEKLGLLMSDNGENYNGIILYYEFKK